MRLNRRQLQNIINEAILRESLHGNYEKIARLLITPFEEDVKQAISLGEAMGYFELFAIEPVQTIWSLQGARAGEPEYNRYHINFHDSDFFKYLVANYTQIPRVGAVDLAELYFGHPYDWLKPGWDYTKGQLALLVKRTENRQGTGRHVSPDSFEPAGYDPGLLGRIKSGILV